MAAHFLSGVRLKQRGAAGTLRHSKDLRDCSVSDWLAVSHNAGLTEVRDVRELQTLAVVMDSISRDELSRAMDVLAMRIESVIQAKSNGGTWEKSQRGSSFHCPERTCGPQASLG